MYRPFGYAFSPPTTTRENGRIVGTPHPPPRGCRPLEPCFVSLAAALGRLEPCFVRLAKKPALGAGFAMRRWYAIVQRGYVEYAVDWHPAVRVQVRGQVALGWCLPGRAGEDLRREKKRGHVHIPGLRPGLGSGKHRTRCRH